MRGGHSSAPQAIDSARGSRRRCVVGTTNSELVAGATAGDQRAWDALVERYTSLLWAIARSYRLPPADAADVVQTTWLRLVEHLERIADPDRLPGWLATTARRECLRLLRRAEREVYSESGVRDAPDDGAPPDAALLSGERDATLWAAFARLDDYCQRLLRVLSTDPPPPYAVVAAALDMKIGSIGPTRARCLAKLRQLLPESEQL